MRVVGDGGSRCTNCGVIRQSDGLCARCLDLPYCKVCKRHLSDLCFNEGQRHICQVLRPWVLYKSDYFFLHVAITFILYFAYLSSVCLQNCEKRRTRQRSALNNTISETSLPVTPYDTSFQTLINTRRYTINDIARSALHQHGY